MVKKEEMITLVKEAIGTMVPILRACISAMAKGSELIANFRNLEYDMGNLRSRMDELIARQQDVMKLVKKELLEQGKKQKREVTVWRKNVKRLKNEVNSIEGKVREEPWFWHRPKLRKNIEDSTIEVAQLQKKGVFPDGVAMEPLVSAASPQPTATLLGESANKMLKRIWNLLLDVKIKKVGVFGMAGVGKTTLMKNIHNQLLESHVFENIIWVTVSKALDLHRLQCEIANAIGLDLSNDCSDNEECRSSKILAALSRKGRCLLILDDLWDAFSLDRIGIPQPTPTNGFKLVITSRSLKVCRNMESERTVKLEILSNDEAWDLFNEKVGGDVLDYEEIKPIAKAIVKECGRLPLALITVGRALREVCDVHVWRNALDELKRPCEDIDGSDDYVFPRLMFSYNRLRNDTLKACFLYCALYPEDHEIYTGELIENWMGEGLIDEIGDRKKEKDKGYTILHDLKDACMIEDGHQDKHVKLHDLIRDLAIIITRRKPRFMVNAGLKLKESPRIEEWTDTMRASLMDNKIKVLSGQPKCLALCTLLLQRNDCLREISNSFFECIRGLKVLDLSGTSIVSLPDGVSELEELRVLQLRACRNLKKLPSVAKLKQLRVLQLSLTAIEEMPRGMEKLVNLRYFDLDGTLKLKMLPAGFISKLSLLEDFRVFGSRWRWASKSTPEGTASADVKEIASLTRLANIDLCFEDVQGFNNFVRILDNLQYLESFKVTFRNETGCKISCGKNAVVANGFGIALSHLSSLLLPYKTEEFQIIHYDISRLSQLPCLANATQIKYCNISVCKDMEIIVMADENTAPNLEKLHLVHLPNLRALTDGNSPVQTFANLKSLVVCSCNKMKNLLTIGLLQCLLNLEIIDVRKCKSMEDIVADDGNDHINNFTFSKLKKLDLWGLGKLKSIWNMGFSCPSLVRVEIIDCEQLKKLPFTSHNLPANLEELNGEKGWWDKLEWEEELKGEEEWWDALEYWEDSIAKTYLQGRFVARHFSPRVRWMWRDT